MTLRERNEKAQALGAAPSRRLTAGVRARWGLADGRSLHPEPCPLSAFPLREF